MKNIFIKLLGGYSRVEYGVMKRENEKLKKQIVNYEALFDKIRFYKGSYPAWKAYGEFLEITQINRSDLVNIMEDYLKKISESIYLYYLSEGKEDEAREWKKNHEHMLETKNKIIYYKENENEIKQN